MAFDENFLRQHPTWEPIHIDGDTMYFAVKGGVRMDSTDKTAIEEFMGPSQYLKFTEDNDFTITGIFKGLKTEDDPFNPGQKRLSIGFEIDGEFKTLGTSSKKLAKRLLDAKVAAGNTIRITRFGEGFDTNYQVKVMTEK